ncbi:MAG TPA: NAD(P)-dependent oxidoreductase [Terriglobales bacterium]
MKLPVEDLENIRARTAPLWEEVRDKRLFVTGGTGFFGCWLMESFCHINRELKLNARATVLTRNPERFARKAPHVANDPAIELLRGDVRDFEFPGGEFDYVVHAATDSTGAQVESTDFELFETIVHGTRHTLDFAQATGAKKFLLLSSGAVYGVQPTDIERVEESYPGAPLPGSPNAVYGEGKRVAELLCRLHSQQGTLECKIARCFAFVGPLLPLDAHFAIGNLIGNAIRSEAMRIRGDGTPLRSYLYMADAMIWLWTILFRAPSGQPLNVGSENAVNIRQLAESVANALSLSAEVVVEQVAKPGAEPARYVPSTRAAQETLGLREYTDLSESIRRTACWYRAAETVAC